LTAQERKLELEKMVAVYEREVKQARIALDRM
jgi:hypothetical protein